MHTFVGAIEDLKPGDRFSVIELSAKGGSFSHYEVIENDCGRVIARDSHMKIGAPTFETDGYSKQSRSYRLAKRDRK